MKTQTMTPALFARHLRQIADFIETCDEVRRCDITYSDDIQPLVADAPRQIASEWVQSRSTGIRTITADIEVFTFPSVAAD